MLYKESDKMKKIKRNEIYYVNFGCGFGSEQSNVRPSLILQNDVGNLHSPTTIVAPFTKQLKSPYMPTHIEIEKNNINNLNENSILLLEQITTVDKSRIQRKIGRITDFKTISKINSGIKTSLGI